MDVPAHVNIETLRKDVEVAATEVAEAEKVCHAAAEAKKVINKIPKGKAGGGKGAKQAANKKYKESKKNANQKTIDLEEAQKRLQNAERALDDTSFTQATTNGNDSGLSLTTLREYSSHTSLQSPGDSDKNNDSGSAGDLETHDHQAVESGVIPPTHRQHFSEGLPRQQPVSEASGEPSDGSKAQSSGAGLDVKMQEQQVSESRISGLIPRERQRLSEELTHQRTVSLDEPLDSDGSKKQGNDLEKTAGVDDYAILELGVTGQVLRRSLDDHQSHEISSNQTPPEGSAKPFGGPNYTAKQPEVNEKDLYGGSEEQDAETFGGPDSTAKQPEVDKKDLYVSGGSEEQDPETLNSPEKEHVSVTIRVSRSTKKKLESAGKGTEAQGAENLCPVDDEVEEDGWIMCLSDPVSDTDDEEISRVAEAVKSKHPSLSAEEKLMYRFMKIDEKMEYDKRARSAINLYLQENKGIDFGIRRMARFDSEFLPEAATTSRKLALHFLTSREGNIMCGYHAFKNKSSCARDGWGKPGMKVRGVPGKRKVGTSEQHPTNGLQVGNCGCMIQDILLEFALSKHISISGFVDGHKQSEMMSPHDYMEPRMRSFAFSAILLLVPDLSLNDFYTHGDVLNHTAGVAKKRSHYWMKTLRSN